ncbi:SR-related and CTD-associated factor 4-like [Syngnathoides biaculeatus]|uniref:SR-related and CTD-associated factor 4-like n=1 Tax=Syngnathoides biaculeatus TaxID=300417 RepID=UPI002ADE1747|nr:SR-related and CTD-associated factor 4-like [Syngnathoides biaculeatus]
MEAVNAFNTELFSIIDVTPPISRAKMMSVTKLAIKAIKLYKHVVQIVEKFIKRCKPELKVPGLYVVDSIIRQSRHQFGVEKDVFGPRFVKNFTDTFHNLYQCPEDDKNKIVRVLNLWQKNDVFGMDIIQPLMDMADGVLLPPPSVDVPTEPQPHPMEAAPVEPTSEMPTSDALAVVARLFQSPHGQELQRMLQNLQQAEKTHMANDTNEPSTHQVNVAQPNMLCARTEERSTLAEKLLDRFDYDDEPEEVATEDTERSLGIPELMHNMETIPPIPKEQNASTLEYGGVLSHAEHHMLPDGFHSTNDVQNSKSQGALREDPSVHSEAGHGAYGKRRSGSKSPRRRRSRSSSRTRRPRHRGSRSHSRESRWRSRSQDRNERERERERRQKGLPSFKSKMLSVCSTTLWVGQLDKKTQQSDVVSLLEEFGQIESINMIPPRGCAYIVMVHRLDAYTALNKLSRGLYKVNGKPVKIAWALNRGIKVTHKKFWDVDQGVTYIPWSKVRAEDLDSYREGGMLDPDTLTEEWKNILDLNKQQAAAPLNGLLESTPASGNVEAQIQVPAVQQVASIGSPPVFLPPVMLSPVSMPPSVGSMPIPLQIQPEATSAGVKYPTEMMVDREGDKPSDLQLGSPTGPAINPQTPPPGLPPMRPPPPHHHHHPPPHVPPFLSPPNAPHPMMPGGPVFSQDRFRMSLPFPPRSPVVHRPPFLRPDGMMAGRAGPPFRGRPGFRGPPRFPRGGW